MTMHDTYTCLMERDGPKSLEITTMASSTRKAQEIAIAMKAPIPRWSRNPCLVKCRRGST